ncbi:MAG: valine--tRNA ligase [Gammaproteobacteria bacterium]|jgi:valyl-tRNA synthetase
MKTTYNPKLIEQPIYQQWEKAGYFKPSGKGKPYCIILPPPNVTGSLHMGHGFQDAIMDALIRYHRMRGFNVLWQPGVDHAGIATQMVVERQLLCEGKSRHDLGRERFIEKVWAWKQESGDTINQQMRRLGASLDWSRPRFTMDDDMLEKVSDVFIQLYDEGLIYRSKRLVNWDPELHTAVSDLEVINEEEKGFLWYIRYPLVGSDEYIIIATTRPETMLGDMAVAVHPEDERYKHLVGKKIKLPLTEREIPIITDDYVEPEFGTGCVKITPAHDFNDYEVGRRHDLPMINVLTFDAKINANAPKKYQGHDRFVARQQIIEDLKALNLLEKVEDYLLKVPRGDRTRVILEPWLTDQWFVKIAPLAKPAIKVVENKKIQFIPEGWENTYFSWMRNIQDWCISRQLWWGHRIPAWYDDEDNIYVARNEEGVRKKYKLSDAVKLRQDEDVLDTWFSSMLWPFATLGWPEKTKSFQDFYPTNVLVTGFDIIFFWVARMIMAGLKLTGEIPFAEVYITGLIRDSHGQKMSKSKGNVLDPIDLIDGIEVEKLVQKRTKGLMQPEMLESIAKRTHEEFADGIKGYGADALRFTFCSLASTSRDINFSFGRLDGCRNFCNKLWNATRYVLQKFEGQRITAQVKLNLVDRWILSKLQRTIKKAHEHFKTYRFDLLAQELYDFTWHEYCDWYLELTKPVLLGDDENAKNSARYTLIYVLENLLKLLHPIIPFVTEKLWQTIAPLAGVSGDTIMLSAYPEFDAAQVDEVTEQELEWIKAVIIGIRTIRSEMNIAPGKKIPVLLNQGTQTDKQLIIRHELLIATLAKLESISWLEDAEKKPNAATTLVGEMEILIPLAGLIDVTKETARLNKEIAKLEKELVKINQKLHNPNFVAKAPKDVVDKEQQRQTEVQTALAKLQQQLIGLPKF